VPVQKLADISRSPLCCLAPIAKPPNSAQLGITPTILPSYIRVRAVVRECSEGQTDAHTAVTTIHFASSTTGAKCNKRQVGHQLYNLPFETIALIFVQPDDKTQKIRLPFCYRPISAEFVYHRIPTGILWTFGAIHISFSCVL